MKKIILTALFMGILLGGHARNTASPFQAVVAQDGSGDYTSIQAAIISPVRQNAAGPGFSGVRSEKKETCTLN